MEYSEIMKKYPVVIGRFEHLDIIVWIDGIPAKIDTGAYRSAIHVSQVECVTKNGKEYLRFTILGHPSFSKKRTIQTRSFQKVTATSSSGQ